MCALRLVLKVQECDSTMLLRTMQQGAPVEFITIEVMNKIKASYFYILIYNGLCSCICKPI